MRHLTYEEWLEEYEPIMDDTGESLKDYHPNVINDKEREEIQDAIRDYKAWTLIDTENGFVISNGLHWVNRIDVYITRNSYKEDEIIEVKY